MKRINQLLSKTIICILLFCSTANAFKLIVTKKDPDEYIKKTKDGSYTEQDPPKKDIVASVEIEDKYIIVSDLFRKIKEDWQDEKGKDYSNLTEFFPTIIVVPNKFVKKFSKKVLINVKDIIELIYKKYFDFIREDINIIKERMDGYFKGEKDLSKEKKQSELIEELENDYPEIGKFLHNGEVDIDKYIKQHMKELRKDEYVFNEVAGFVKIKLKKIIGGRTKTKLKSFRLQATKPEFYYPDYIDEYAKLLRISSYVACDAFEVASRDLLLQKIYELSSKDLYSLIKKPREDIKHLKHFPVEFSNLSKIRTFHNINNFSFLSDSLKIIIQYIDNRVGLYDVNSGRLIKEFENVSSYQLSYSEEEESVLIKYIDNRAGLYDINSGKVIKEFDDVERCEFFDSVKKLLIKYIDNKVRLYDVNSGKMIKEFDDVESYCFFDSGKKILIKYIDNIDNRVGLYDINSGDLIKKFDNVNWYRFSECQSKILIYYNNDSIGLYESKTGDRLQIFNNVISSVFTICNTHAFILDQNKMAVLCDMNTGKIVKKFSNVLEGVFVNESKLTIKYKDDKEESYDINTGTKIVDNDDELNNNEKILDSSEDEYYDVKNDLIKDFYNINYSEFDFPMFSPNYSIFLVKYNDDKVRLYDFHTGMLIQNFDNVYTFDFHWNNGSKLLIQYQNRELKLYDINKFKLDLEGFVFIVLALREKENLLDNEKYDSDARKKMRNIWKELDGKVRAYLTLNGVPDLNEK